MRRTRRDRRSPPEKKRDRLDRDRVTGAEYPHAFRRSWPKKKAAAERAHRRAVTGSLMCVARTGGDAGDVPRRRQVRKWGTISVRERVSTSLDRRIQTTGARRIRTRCFCPRHRARLMRFLESLVQLDAALYADRARAVSDRVTSYLRMDAHGLMASHPPGMSLTRFFLEEPAVRAALAAWLTRAGAPSAQLDRLR